MTFKVTGIDQYGRRIIRRGLSKKRASGLCADYRTWGFRNIIIAAETNEADKHNGWIALFLSVCILGFIIVCFINFLLG